MDMMSNQCMEDEKLNKWSLKDQEKYMNAAVRSLLLSYSTPRKTKDY